MNKEDSNKSARGKKRRMYQSFEDDTATKVDVEVETNEEIDFQRIPSSQTKIESLNEVKFKTSILSKTKQKELGEIVKSSVFWNMGFSLVPIPFVDSFLISSMQLRMIDQISQKYNVPFNDNVGKAFIATLASSTSYHFGTQVIKSLVKKIPIIGIASSLVSPVIAAATTYAIAKVFIYHFELGGNLLDFKPEKVREYFAKQFEDGKSKLNEMRTDYDFINS